VAKKPATVVNKKKEAVIKKTSDGASKNTRYTSKNDKNNKKLYRGQGR
jgi:hypothetical protein